MTPLRPSPRTGIAGAALVALLCLPAGAQVTSLPEPLATLRLQDPAQTLTRLDRAYRTARQLGDAHAEWLALAQLLPASAALDQAASEPLLALAEQALDTALRVGDREAAEALALAIESTRVEHGFGPLRPDRLALLQAAASGDARQGAVAQLQGLAALQAGQVGEALFQYRRAAAGVAGNLALAGLKLRIARAMSESGAAADTAQALALLDEVDRLLPADRYPAFIESLLLRSTLTSRSPAAAAQAVALARRAAAVARQSGQPTPWARAQLALGQALLAQGDSAQAVLSLEAATPDALPTAERLSRQAGLALALARSGRAEAAGTALAQGTHLLQAQDPDGGLPVLRFLETAAQVHEAMGDPAAALQTLELANAQRLPLADEARQRLVQARSDIAQQSLARDAAASSQALLAWAGAALGAATLALAGLALRDRQRRRRLVDEARQRQEANEAQARALVDRSEQLAAACHELRQPAHVLGLLIDTAPDEAQALPGDIDEHLESVHRCGHTLADMLQPLMALSQINAAAPPRLAPVSLGDLLAELDLQFRHAALDKGLSWHVGTSAAWVRSDRQMLRRVLFRLVAGALRASSQGGVQVLVMAAPGSVSLEVAYAGPGLQAAGGSGAGEAPSAAERDMTRVRQACQHLGHTLSLPVSSPRGSVVRVGMASAPAPAAPTPAPFHPAMEALQA